MVVASMTLRELISRDIPKGDTREQPGIGSEQISLDGNRTTNRFAIFPREVGYKTIRISI